MSRRVSALMAALALFSSTLFVQEAHAQGRKGPPDGFGWSGNGDAAVAEGGVDSEVRAVMGEYDGSPRSTSPVRRGVVCSTRPVDPGFERERHLARNEAVPSRASFYWLTCDGVDHLRYYIPGRPPAEDETLGPLVEEAFDRLEPEVPSLVTSPPLGSEVLTGLPMYLAVGEGSFGVLSGSVSAGQFTVTASVVPVSSRFVPGDGGESVECVGWGSVWSVGERPSEGDCTYTFTHTPAHLGVEGESFEVSGRVVYEARYVVEGPMLAGEYDLGSFEGPEVVVEVPVIERRAVRTTAGG